MQDAYERIRSAGLKLTPRRRAIVSLLAGQGSPLSPRQVQAMLKQEFSQCGLPGIYRNLEALTACGVLFRVAGFGRERSYAFCGMPRERQTHHHHIICISCGRSAHVEECRYREGMMIGGFRLVDHFVQLHGLCEACSTTEDRS